MLSGDIPPNQTIYIKNLNEKLSKDELKRSLYCLFSQFGRILDVVALKTPKLRGQAWVCFSEITAASNAVRQMQNFPFYDKLIRLQYAKSMSDCLVDKKKKQDDQAEKKRHTEGTQHTSNGTATQNNGATSASHRKPEGREAATPNNILFVQNLPYNTTGMMVKMLFGQYPGFREVRMIEAKPGIGFVEFEDEEQASVAMQALQGFKIDPQNPMEITYAKK